MFKRNLDIRSAKGQIPMWVIAERLNISENTFRNWMRKEMDPDKKALIFSAIVEIKADLNEYGATKITKDSLPVL